MNDQMHSNDLGELIPALLEARKKVKPAGRSGRAATYGQGKKERRFADLADVQAACVPPMLEHGLVYTIYLDGHVPGKAIYDPRDFQEEWAKTNTGKSYRKKTPIGDPCPMVVDTLCPVVCMRLMHTSGQWMVSRVIVPIVENDPQKLGGAITYAHRYLLQHMMGVVTEDDDAESAMHHRQPVSSQPQERARPAPPVQPVPAVLHMIALATSRESLTQVWIAHIGPRPQGPERAELEEAAKSRAKEIEEQEAKVDA